MKPTIVNLIFACVLIVSNILYKKNFLKIFLQSAFQLDDIGWNKLNFRGFGKTTLRGLRGEGLDTFQRF